MLEQWEADQLLSVRKVYSYSTTIGLNLGTNSEHYLESDSGTEFFILDIYRSNKNRRKARFQLRYRREVVLSRLCTAVPHQNPDGTRIGMPHLHRYSERYGDKFAVELGEFPDVPKALEFFCETINLPKPDMQGDVIS